MLNGSSRKEAIRLYKLMHTYRQFEKTVGQSVLDGEIHGEMHLAIGQEIGAAVLAQLLQPEDSVVSTHRNHLHALAKGVDPVALLAELREREGINSGKGGHMHIFDAKNRFMATGIVGASAPPALGYALAQVYRGEQAITVCCLGDAAMNQGAVFESLNLAAVKKLPVLFLVEDNKLGISVRPEVSTAGKLEDRGIPFGIPGFRGDGSDQEDVTAVLTKAVSITRKKQKPTLVVLDVVRMRGHYEGDPDLYRDDEERPREGSANDPLESVKTILNHFWGITLEELTQAENEAKKVVQDWDKKSLQYPLPNPVDARKGVFHDE